MFATIFLIIICYLLFKQSEETAYLKNSAIQQKSEFYVDASGKLRDVKTDRLYYRDLNKGEVFLYNSATKVWEKQQRL